MTTASTRIRDAIVARLTDPELLPVTTIRTQPRPQIQEEDLPALLVFVVGESERADGDENAGVPAFLAEITIGISLVAGYDQPFSLDRDLDERIDAIRTRLLTDPTFVRFGPDETLDPGDADREPFFEGIERIQRRRLFPQDGESYVAEVRLEITFTRRTEYPPVLTDTYRGLRMRTRPYGHDDATPAIETRIPQA